MSSWSAENFIGDKIGDVLSLNQPKRKPDPSTDNNNSSSQSSSTVGRWARFAKDHYDTWALNNADSVGYVESTLKTVMFFLPGRFSEHELLSELFYSGVNLFGIYHDSLWLKFAVKKGNGDLDVARTLNPFIPLEASEAEEWAIQYNADTQSVPDPNALSEKAQLPPPLADSDDLRRLETASLIAQRNNASGLSGISIDVQQKLSKIFKRLPNSLTGNANLHTVLSAIDNTELSLELLATHLYKKYSKETAAVAPSAPSSLLSRASNAIVSNLKWLVIFALELLKAVIRLILLAKGGGRILTNQAVPSRDTLFHKAQIQTAKEFIQENSPAAKVRQQRKTLQAVAEARRRHFPTTPTLSIMLGELLWILRPVIYLLALARYGRGSWKPWFISLLTDLSSRSTTWNVSLSEEENSEMYRRGFLWFFYLMRSPFFESLFGGSPSTSSSSSSTPIGEPGRIAALLEKVKGLPLVNMVSGSATELMGVFRKRYFYTAGSSS